MATLPLTGPQVRALRALVKAPNGLRPAQMPERLGVVQLRVLTAQGLAAECDGVWAATEEGRSFAATLPPALNDL